MVCFLVWVSVRKGGCILTYILGVDSWGQIHINTLSMEIILESLMGGLCCMYSTGCVGCAASAVGPGF